MNNQPHICKGKVHSITLQWQHTEQQQYNFTTGVPKGEVWGFKPPQNYSEVLTKPSRILSSVENTS
jgi:hypothetical protein